MFGASAGFSDDAAPPRVRGTIEQVNGNTLTIKTRSGSPTTVQLKDGAPVVAVTEGSMSDIQMNSLVGIAAMPQPDGTIKAVEVSVFAEPLRGTAEGHYPWDLMPGSSMTNAAVTQQVTKQEGNTLTLNIALTFRPSFSGQTTILMEASDGSLTSGLQARGTWVVP